MTDDTEIARGIDRAIFPGMTANCHTNRITALMAAASDMLRFGSDYARACHANAKALADAFHREGLTVAGYEQGSTHGHMLALDVRQQGMARATALALESAHIICNFNLLPWDPLKAVRNPSGLRLAVHEITRCQSLQSEVRPASLLFRLKGRPTLTTRPPLSAFGSIRERPESSLPDLPLSGLRSRFHRASRQCRRPESAGPA